MKQVALKDICIKGSSPYKQKELLADGRFAVYGASGIAGYLDSYAQETNYIGIVKDGSGIGRVDFYPAKTSLIGTMQYILPKNGYDIRYIGYCLKSLDLSKYKQGAAIPHIYFKDYGERIVRIVEDEKEQQRIVSRLDAAFAHIDELKANAEKQLSEARALFQKALEKAMEPKEGVRLSKIADVAIRITKGASPKWQGINYVDNDGVLFITSENVRDGFIELNPPKYVDEKFNQKQQRSILKKNDVLVNIVGASIGRAAIYDLDVTNANINQAVALVRIDSQVLLPKYLCMFLNSSIAFEEYCLLKKDTARANLSLENIGDLVLYVPTLEVQKQIINRLDSLSENVKKLEGIQRKIIAECDALKQALLRKVFE